MFTDFHENGKQELTTLSLSYPASIGRVFVLLFASRPDYREVICFPTVLIIPEPVKYFKASEAQKCRKLHTPQSGVWVQLE